MRFFLTMPYIYYKIQVERYKYEIEVCMDCPKCPRIQLFSPRKKDRAAALNADLKSLYPDAVCALEFAGDPFRLLVMARLSAQCTDKRVNEVAPRLFARFPDVYSMQKAPLPELEEIIRPCGLYRAKARQILQMCTELIERHRGEVPRTKAELTALSGVGIKIAHLMLGDVFGDPQIVADTHCIRLAHRFGLTASSEPHRVTRDLERLIPKEDRADFCHRIITLGREACRARNPLCETCPLIALKMTKSTPDL